MERVLKRLPLHKLMDLKVDYAFKQLFGNNKNKHITMIFLNAILNRQGEDSIQDITFINNEFSAEHRGDKESRLDILATTNKNERVNIEIQFNNRYDMVKRSLYYWAGIYREPLQKSMGYKELKPVILINIVNFHLFDETEKFQTTYHLYEDEDRFQLTDVLEMHFLKMPKLITDWKKGKLNPRDSILARWLLLLGVVDKKNQKIYEDIFKELEEIAMSDENLQEAFKHWEKLSEDTNKWFEYEARLKVVLDDLAAVREAELRYEEALKKGLEDGLKKGHEKGHEKGLQEGREKGIKEGQQKNQRQIAKRMLEKGIDNETVAELTGLTTEEVAKIKGV